ncbi:3-deoxy-D-manno-octulosonic acid transferase [Myxococcota bacterium]|nr:3-deoxy-D-manno-octulosonic acid transferase [Myxococcota bacterium]
MRFLSAILAYPLFLIALPFLLGHKKLRHGIWARMGFFSKSWPKLKDGPRVWVHGASAGDVLALLPLVREMRQANPEVQVVVTTITNSGRAMAKRYDQEFDAIGYMPYDLPGPVWRTLRRIKADVLVLEYTELWPQIIYGAHARGTPVVLHNGRFSAKNLNSYRRLFFVVGNLLRRLSLLLMRDEAEAARALDLGANKEKVHITGNTKFDNLVISANHEHVKTLRKAANLPDNALVWVAGSTHEGEEEILFGAFNKLRKQFPNLYMIIAPRYVERGDKVMALAKSANLSVRLRTEPGKLSDVLILNSIGELASCYELANIVFVGGSFIKRGGQNILEPAALAKPVLFGPYMSNFADSVKVLLGRGGIQIANPEQLIKVLSDLLADPKKSEHLGEMGRDQVLAIRGAAKRNAEAILALLPTD